LLFPRLAAADSTFVLPRAEAPAPSHTKAYAALGVGVALTAGSFALASSADDAYARYLGASDPAEITSAYDDAARLDHWSAGLLLAGTSALALGVYWRFIQRPPPANTTSFDVEPHVTAHHAGLALALRWP
jgi:hypothetical protein